MTEQLSLWLTHRSHSHTLILEAVKTHPNMTYTQIRKWITQVYKVDIEDVGRRVRELAQDSQVFVVRERGRVHVYLLEEQK